MAAKSTPKTPVPTDKQRAVLDACKGGRAVAVTATGGKKTVGVVGPTGKPVKDHPKLDRAAVERCVALGWVAASGGQGEPDGSTTAYKITETGAAAKRRKPAAK